MRRPVEKLQRGDRARLNAPKGGPVAFFCCVAALAKGYGHCLRTAPSRKTRQAPQRRSLVSQRFLKGLHHNAYRCRDSEETRAFYEDFLGLPLKHSFVIETTKSGRPSNVLHSFFQMHDGSFMAFFEDVYKRQHAPYRHAGG